MTTATPSGTRPVAAAMAQAAAAWLGDLDDGQRASGWWGPPGGSADDERRRWFYTPTDHGGLTLAEQSPVQQRHAMTLVAAGLSPEGYDLVSTILGTENILDRVEGFSAQFHTPRGRDPSRYYLRVFGDPMRDATWGWRFGGHHVSLNFVVVDGEVGSTTPRFLGSDPAVSLLPGGAVLQPLSGFESPARTLVTLLDENSRADAVLLDRAPADLVMGNRSSFVQGATMMALPDLFRRQSGDESLVESLRAAGETRDAETRYDADDHATVSVTSAPKGVSGSRLDADQTNLLRRLVEVYDEVLSPSLRAPVDLDDLHFGWAGPLEAGAPHYYRLQDHHGLLIEWDNTARNGNHAHGVVRDFVRDFGGDPLGAHRRSWHRQARDPSGR
jgi:hypothetical protein